MAEKTKALRGLAFASVAVVLALPAGASDQKDESYHQDYIYGAPETPSESWMISLGGRLYDNWYDTLGVDGPARTHPSWPSSNTLHKGADTWRCKSCHGFDFRGADGISYFGSYRTGIKGIRGALDRDPKEIAALLRDGTHQYTPDMIGDDKLAALALFVSKGQYDTLDYINPDKSVNGIPERGREIFQTTCAACHGFDGRAMNWGTTEEPGYVGTEANKNPWEVLGKIRHGHPGAEMISLAAFAVEEAADVLKYAQTLPQK